MIRAMTEGHDKPTEASLPSGGVETKFSENVDLSNPKDAGLIRQLAKGNPRRWKLSEHDRERVVQCTMAGVEAAAETGDLTSLAALGRLVVTMEGQNQKDEELEDKNKRLDQGLTTENVTFVVQPPRVIGE